MRALLAALLPLLALALAGCAASTTTTSGPAATIVAEGDASGMRFAPASVTLHPGETVLFRVGSGHHTVDFDNGTVGASQLHSGDMGPQQSFAVRFSQPGTFQFTCRYHSGMGMRGTVVVEA